MSCETTHIILYKQLVELWPSPFLMDIYVPSHGDFLTAAFSSLSHKLLNEGMLVCKTAVLPLV